MPLMPDSAAEIKDTLSITNVIVEDSASVICKYDSVPLTEFIPEYEYDWKSGMEGSSRQGATAGNSCILTIIVILFVAISLNFKECRRLYGRFISELFNDKKRENAFDEHSNHERRLTILTIIQYLVYGSIILFGIAHKNSGQTVSSYSEKFFSLAATAGLFSAYYIFQLCAYSLIGYTFTDKEEWHRWLRAFNASQSLAGVTFIIPALLVLFYPATSNGVMIISVVLYIIARLMFIIKGFSIFYNNIFSLVYFILYLCALEIIPAIYVYKLALLIA